MKGNANIAPEMKKQPTITSLWGTKKRKRGDKISAGDETETPSTSAEGVAETSTSLTSNSSTLSSPLTVLNVHYDLKDKNHSGEGRTITLEFPNFYLVNCYVPNSGQRLERLSYRTTEWFVPYRIF